MLFGIVLLCLSLIQFVVSAKPTPKRTMLIGELKKGDKVLFMIDVRKKAQKDKVLTEYVVYPPENVFRNLTINFIAVVSLSKSFAGGYPAIISGGITFKHVTIRLRSDRGAPLDYLVGVYGQ